MFESVIATMLAASLAMGPTVPTTVPQDSFAQVQADAQHPEAHFEEPFEIHDFSSIATPIVYGVSGEGRELVAYELGDGDNHLILNFAVHGWEDEYPNSGRDIERMGEMTLAYCSLHPELLEQGNWTVYVIPTSNPDGLMAGYTDYGPGRCTTTQFAADGYTIVSGGIDINRSFPGDYGFAPSYGGRYNTTGNANWCTESQGLKEFLDSHVSYTGKNVFVDSHGYYSQILVDTNDYFLYNVFEQNFHFGKGAFGPGAGYIINYTHDCLGMDSCLFEFPWCGYDGALFDRGYDQKFLQAISQILTQYPGRA